MGFLLVVLGLAVKRLLTLVDSLARRAVIVRKSEPCAVCLLAASAEAASSSFADDCSAGAAVWPVFVPATLGKRC